MKTEIYTAALICLFFMTGVYDVNAQDSLREGFADPPASAKARTWWHWLDGNVTKEGITADLEAMKRAGIQEAQIFNVGMGYPQGPATYLGDLWLELFHFAVQEADRLGLEIGFNNAAGWANSGGPWVTPEYAMQKVVFSETKHRGKATFRGTLPLPPTRLGYYADIAVLAFPAPESDERIGELELKTLSGHFFPKHLQPDDRPVDGAALVPRDRVVNLTSKMSADGVLNWDAPAGEWIILRIGHTPTGTENRPSVRGGTGLECDKMSRAAVDHFWQGGIRPVLDRLGLLAGKSLVNCIIDSYEVGCCNWTPGFDAAFKQRNGYDCIPFLPALAGYYVGSGEITERFLWDFRRTTGDLIVENYYGRFRELCHRHGMKFSVEPYGGPYEDIQAGSTGDIVMSEFWLEGDVYLNTQKMVASAAHLNGSPVVGAESFTGFGGWRNHPATLKARGDLLWCEGVNRFIFHTCTHQPWDVAPGVTFGLYGLEVGRHTTWWEPGRAYMDYLARSQFLLQQGRSVADVLVFTGEEAPNDGIYRADIKALGYDYDQIGTNKIKELTVKDGRLCSPAGGVYKLLLLPETAWMTPELADKINELVTAGAIVTGARPAKSPSLRGYPECDAKVAALAEKIWDESGKITKGKVIANRPVKDLLEELAPAPDFSGGKTGFDLTYIHRITDRADIYFVANPRNISRREACRFRITGKVPRLWNPQTGEIQEAAVWKEEAGGTTVVPVSFEPEGAVFVVFEDDGRPVPEHLIHADATLKTEELTPLPGLKIVRAEYGRFLPKGLADATEGARDRLSKGIFTIPATPGLTNIDPAAGVVKELRIEYRAGGELHRLQAQEGQSVLMDIKDEKEIESIRAVYGKFTPDTAFLPPVPRIEDVSGRISELIASHQLQIPADDRLTGKNPSGHTASKELRLTYVAEGETHDIKVPEGGTVSLAYDLPGSRLVSEDGLVSWITPYAGEMTYVTSSGKTGTVRVDSVPEPVELKGAWDVSFPPGLGAPAKAVFDRLISWPASSDEGIRYFSGTASYKKQFSLPAGLLQPGYLLELDLGSVRVMAEVIVNGKNLGVLWKAPFRVNLDHSVHQGVNELEIKITNLWPNRLIGDERLSGDYELEGWSIKKWPEWLLNHTERPSERITFTTWKHWDKDAPLLPSGLLGPVKIRPYVRSKNPE
ncbi:MAG: hypothetical protein LBL07_14145 [Tannerella sp.]|nr:hypothetical protein [Tannerella sp.]